MKNEVAVIVGVGARLGIGGAVSVKAAQEGLHVFIVGRTQSKLALVEKEIRDSGGEVTSVIADCTKESDIQNVFDKVSETGKNLKLVVYNVGRNLPAPFMEHDHRIIEDHWKRCVLGAMFVGQHAIRKMLAQDVSPTDKRGSIIYTGASASMRGRPMFAGFASAKGGLRGMIQSMSDEFSHDRIHVSHPVIDGVVDGKLIRSVKGVGGLVLKLKGDKGALLPDEIAKSFWMIHSQRSGAWTHELDLRPFKESF